MRIKSDPSRGGLVHQVVYRNVCIRNTPNRPNNTIRQFSCVAPTIGTRSNLRPLPRNNIELQPEFSGDREPASS